MSTKGIRKVRAVLVAIFLLGIGGLCSSAEAQVRAKATPNGVVLSWTQSNSAGVNGNKVYRASCGAVTGTTGADGSVVGTCSGTIGTYSAINTSVTPITTYIDNSGQTATSYAYYITATCSTCSTVESGPSNVVGVTTSLNPQPTPPSNLTITASNEQPAGNGKVQVGAAWKDSLGVQTGYFLWAGVSVVKSGTPKVNNSGAYSFTWKGKQQNSMWLDVCDATSYCQAIEF